MVEWLLAFGGTILKYVSWPIRWLLRLYRRFQEAVKEAEALARQRMERRLKFLEEELERENDPERKRGLEREVKKARDELIGLDIQLAEQTLERAKLPDLDKLAEIGRHRLASDDTDANQNNSAKSGKGIGG